eukprot:m.224065 g.224065  ORF g.224065 m.224065 type:complete len:164 (+) comp17029_c0_seq2:4538-5029(+)
MGGGVLAELEEAIGVVAAGLRDGAGMAGAVLVDDRLVGRALGDAGGVMGALLGDMAVGLDVLVQRIGGQAEAQEPGFAGIRRRDVDRDPARGLGRAGQRQAGGHGEGGGEKGGFGESGHGSGPLQMGRSGRKGEVLKCGIRTAQEGTGGVQKAGWRQLWRSPS